MKAIIVLSLLMFSSLSFADTKKTVTDPGVVAAADGDKVNSRTVASNSEPIISDATASVEAKHPNYVKNWLVALGPVVSNSLVPSNQQSGTKFAINLAYTQGLSEYWNLLFLYDSSFNSVATGSSVISTMNVGVQYFLWDRLSNFSPWASVQVGYGGGNRTADATEAGSGAIGVDFARTQSATYSFYVRNSTMYASDGRSLANWPNVTQVMVGINF